MSNSRVQERSIEKLMKRLRSYYRIKAKTYPPNDKRFFRFVLCVELNTLFKKMQKKKKMYLQWSLAATGNLALLHINYLFSLKTRISVYYSIIYFFKDMLIRFPCYCCLKWRSRNIDWTSPYQRYIFRSHIKAENHVFE